MYKAKLLHLGDATVAGCYGEPIPYSKLKDLGPPPEHILAGFKVGKTEVEIRQYGDASKWKTHFYGDKTDSWIVDVAHFRQTFLALMSDGSFAELLFDAVKTPGLIDVTMVPLEIDGSFDRDEGFTSHVFDVETDYGVSVVHVVVKGESIVEIHAWV